MVTLSSGSTGSLVSALQLALSRSGYYTGKIDGIFGPQTLAAVKAFQSDNGLVSDGIAGPKTWSALEKWLTGYITVTVKSGDTFWTLSQKYGVSPEDIAAANPGINPENLQIGSKLTVPLSFALVPTDIPYSSFLTGKILKGLAARYPFITLSEAGKSVMGTPLWVAKIGTGRREYFYNAAFHANEWITTPVMLKFLEEYSAAYTSGGKIYDLDAHTLYYDSTLYLMPLVNPDGVDLVTGALNSGGYFDKARALAANYPSIAFPSGWKANINGVDLNLQFPAQWETAREIKFAQGYTSPGPRDYVGGMPLCQPESRAVYDFTRQHDFTLILAYHTQGSIIYWRFDDYEPENSLKIGREFSRISGYPLENTPYTSGFAGYKDWFIQEYNRPGYTFEVGAGTNPLPLSQFSEIYNDNVGVLASALLKK